MYDILTNAVCAFFGKNVDSLPIQVERAHLKQYLFCLRTKRLVTGTSLVQAVLKPVGVGQKMSQNIEGNRGFLIEHLRIRWKGE